MLNSGIHPVVQALLMERKSEKQVVNKPSSCQIPIVGQAASILKTRLGILTFGFCEYETQLCIYSLDKLTQLRENPDIFVLQNSESVSRGGNEAIERPDKDCPSPPAYPCWSLFWNSHSGCPQCYKWTGSGAKTFPEESGKAEWRTFGFLTGCRSWRTWASITFWALTGSSSK